MIFTYLWAPPRGRPDVASTFGRRMVTSVRPRGTVTLMARVTVVRYAIAKMIIGCVVGR